MVEETKNYNAPVNVLAREVAKAFHGEVKVNSDWGFHMDSDWGFHMDSATVSCNGPKNGHITDFDIDLSIKSWGSDKGKLFVSMGKRLLPDANSYNFPTRPNAGMSMDRGNDVVIKNIGKRIVYDSQAAIYLAEVMKRNEEITKQKEDLLQVCEKVKKIFPEAVLRHNQDSTLSRDFYLKDRPSIDFRVTYNDEIYFPNRIGTISWDKAARILAILVE